VIEARIDGGSNAALTISQILGSEELAEEGELDNGKLHLNFNFKPIRC
jgi:hypothetical protein